MTDNVLIAIIAASGVIISAIFVLGGAIFAYMASSKGLDKIERTLELIQGDMRQWSEQIFNIKAHLKMD